MKPFMAFFAALFAVALFTAPVQAANPMDDKEATPSLKERLMKDAISGTLMNQDGEYYTIKDEDGKQHRVHVDKSTKLDKVVAGDHVKAYITEQGHATTLQRKEH